MSESSAHTLIRYEGKAAIIDCLDVKLNDEMTIQAWNDEISEALANMVVQDRIIINFANVKFMSSSALRALISLKAKVDKKNATLFLCNICPNNMEVFKITKLNALFRITPTEVEAQRAVV